MLLQLHSFNFVTETQVGFGGIVYDPTTYANAVLRYNQLVQQLTQRHG